MSKTILIVDDSSTLRDTVAQVLRADGYEVVEGVDGSDALAKLDGRKVHLIISDVNMPNLDGLSFVRKVRDLPAYRFTPVIMLTTEAGEAKRAEGAAAGVKAWMVKPFMPQQMLTAVRKLVLP
ncbi:response regulator [Chitinibacteraceae bacterium HSL-7]